MLPLQAARQYAALGTPLTSRHEACYKNEGRRKAKSAVREGEKF